MIKFLDQDSMQGVLCYGMTAPLFKSHPLGSVAPSNPYLSLQMSHLEVVDTDSGHLPSILLHSCTLSECSSVEPQSSNHTSSHTLTF